MVAVFFWWALWVLVVWKVIQWQLSSSTNSCILFQRAWYHFQSEKHHISICCRYISHCYLTTWRFVTLIDSSTILLVFQIFLPFTNYVFLILWLYTFMNKISFSLTDPACNNRMPSGLIVDMHLLYIKKTIICINSLTHYRLNQLKCTSFDPWTLSPLFH